MSATSLRCLSSRHERKRQNLNHQNRSKNNRKIVARRRRRANLCNKLALYHEYRCKVNYLADEPRTKNPHRYALITARTAANWRGSKGGDGGVKGFGCEHRQDHDGAKGNGADTGLDRDHRAEDDQGTEQ